LWLGLAVVLSVAYAAWRWRAHSAGWLLGAILICVVPSNSVLPKNELIREWRLYPSLPFFALLVGHCVDVAERYAARTGARALRYAPRVALTVYLAAFVHSNVLQNRTYATALATWEQVLTKYPYSADAMNNIGISHYQARRFDEARTYFAMAVDAAPDVSLFRQNLAHAYSALGDEAAARKHAAEAARVRTTYGHRTMALHFRR
jgi:tetratricopeptide (TPR) repeat protein